MTERDHRALVEYCRDLADKLELRDWTIIVDQGEPEDEEAVASCNAVYGQRRARLWFSDQLRGRDLEYIRDSVVHELIHCHLEAAWDTTRDIATHIGSCTYSVFSASITRQMEYAVDAFSRAVAKHLPLIEWPTS